MIHFKKFFFVAEDDSLRLSIFFSAVGFALFNQLGGANDVIAGHASLFHRWLQ
jgi:hypothetical protein